MKVLIQVANKYQYIMPVFCEMFNKYWKDQECVLICFKQMEVPLPDNFEIVFMGDDCGWTDNFKKFLSTFKDEYFVLHLDDHILFDYVKLDKLKIMEDEIINGADKAMLHSHLNINAKPYHDSVLMINQDSAYRTSIHTAIWRTEYFLKNIRDKKSIWSFETQTESLNDGAKIVSLKSENRYHDHIVNFLNLLRGGKVDVSMTGLWHEEDLDILLKIPFDKENRDILIRKTNNICPKCNKKVDLMLLTDRPTMKKYEKDGLCCNC